MKQVPFTNKTDQVRTIGDKLIPPGGTRFVDARLLPGHQAEKPAAPVRAHSHPILPLLQRNVGDIIKTLPALSAESFNALWQGELDGKSRKSLKEGFKVEQIRRAAVEASAQQRYDEFLETLSDQSDEDLSKMLAQMTSDGIDQVLIDAVEAVTDARKAQNPEGDDD